MQINIFSHLLYKKNLNNLDGLLHCFTIYIKYYIIKINNFTVYYIVIYIYILIYIKVKYNNI